MKLLKENNMVNYEEVTDVVNKLIKDTKIPEIQQGIVAEYITDELLRKIDFYSNKFYMIMTEDGKFVRYGTSSSGSKEVFIGMAASSATVFDDVVTCNEVYDKCQSKYPSETFLLEAFEY